jgi:hypothetical protein
MSLILGYLVAEKMVGLKVVVEHAVYQGQPRIRVLQVQIQVLSNDRRAWAL